MLSIRNRGKCWQCFKKTQYAKSIIQLQPKSKHHKFSAGPIGAKSIYDRSLFPVVKISSPRTILGQTLLIFGDKTTLVFYQYYQTDEYNRGSTTGRKYNSLYYQPCGYIKTACSFVQDLPSTISQLLMFSH